MPFQTEERLFHLQDFFIQYLLVYKEINCIVYFTSFHKE